MLTTVIYIVLGAFVLGMAFSPRFRNNVLRTLGIRVNDALDKATTHTEKARYEYEKLKATVEKETATVTSVKGKHRVAVKDYETAVANVAKQTEDLKLAAKANASEELLNDQTKKVTNAEADRDAKAARVADYASAAKEALTALQSAQKKLKEIASKIENAENSAELAKVLNSTADAIQEAKAIDDVTSKIGAELRKVDEEVETARAKMDMAKGSSTEQEMEQIREKEQLAEARKRLLGESTGDSTTQQQ